MPFLRNRRLMVIGAVVLLSFLVSRFWFQLMLIQGDSMTPTYHSWQFVLLQKQVEEYRPGDVIAFRAPGVGQVVVKRIVACPGDTVQIREGVLYRNGEAVILGGEPLEEPGLAAQFITLGADEYFVLGDNHAQSIDSRYSEIGNARRENIIGLVIPQKTLLPNEIIM